MARLLNGTTYVVLLTISTSICTWVVYYGWQRRDRAGGLLLSATYALIFVWSGSSLVLSIASDPGVKFVALRGLDLGRAYVPPLTLFLFLEVTGFERYVTRRNVALVCGPATLAFLLALTNPIHGLLYTGVDFVPGFVGVTYGYAPLFQAQFLYNSALLTAATLVALRQALAAHKTIYRRQAMAAFVSVVPPWVGGALQIFTPVRAELAPIGLTLSGVVLAYAVYRTDFGEVVPIARSSLMDTINTGVLVVDTEGRILDANAAIKRIFDLEVDLVGRELSSLVSEDFDVERFYREIQPIEEEVREELVRTTDGGTEYYQVLVTPLYDRRERRIGETYVVSDITEQRRREEQLREREAQLERKNDRLDQFASIVSHDLRNPLTVAMGNAQLVRSRLEAARGNIGDDVLGSLEDIEGAHRRMEQIIEDGLELARHDDAVSATEPVRIEAAAREAWLNVATEDATIEFDGDATLRADRDSLLNVFENLFRNAVEHGTPDPTVGDGDDRSRATDDAGGGSEDGVDDPADVADRSADPDEGITVTVGPLADCAGFYVADDGPGIPPAERDAVLDEGYTTSEGGTGLGLSIVSQIAEAHDWTVEITESARGGARFELSPADGG